MDILIKGPGEVVICFIDSKGKTLLQERLRSSGSDTVSARRPVSLFMETRNGRIPVSPVLVRHSRHQRVTFDGDEPVSFTKKRCREIGCTEAVAEEAGRGRAQLLRADAPQTPSYSLPRP